MQLVSIIMAAYNAGRYIAESIETVISQTYPNWELIIVNDGSEDNTRSIADSYASNDKRISVINQVNKKQAAARNTGLNRTTGNWVIFLDADDLWENSILEKLIAASETYPQAGVIYTGGWIMYNDDKNNIEPYPSHEGLISPDKMYQHLYDNNCIPNQSGMIKRQIIRIAGLQNEEKLIQGCEDYDYWMRITVLGTTYYGIEEKLFFYRRHTGNMSSDLTQMRLANASVMIRNYNPRGIHIDMANKKFRPHIYPAVVRLLKVKKCRDAIYILSCYNKIMPAFRHKLVMIFILIFGRYAVIPFSIAASLRSY